MKLIPKIRAPRGFKFVICVDTRYARGNVTIHLYDNKVKSRSVGQINLCKYYYNTTSFETHSNLGQKYRNKGIGALMYARAIQYCLENGYKVRSSGASSYDACRVWQGETLRKYFTIKKRGSTWFAYPKQGK